MAYPSHAHPGPTWQVLLREMQVLPQALPTEQTLQQESALCSDPRAVTDRRTALSECSWWNSVACVSAVGIGGLSENAGADRHSSARQAKRVRIIRGVRVLCWYAYPCNGR